MLLAHVIDLSNTTYFITEESTKQSKPTAKNSIPKTMQTEVGKAKVVPPHNTPQMHGQSCAYYQFQPIKPQTQHQQTKEEQMDDV